MVWSFTKYHVELLDDLLNRSRFAVNEDSFEVLAPKPTRSRPADFRFGWKLKPVVRTGLDWHQDGTTIESQNKTCPFVRFLNFRPELM